MKKNKIISGLLAGALVVTSVFTTGWNEARAAEKDSLAASYSFENGLANDAGEDAASAIVKGLGAYSGTPVYEEGFRERQRQSQKRKGDLQNEEKVRKAVLVMGDGCGYGHLHAASQRHGGGRGRGTDWGGDLCYAGYGYCGRRQ